MNLETLLQSAAFYVKDAASQVTATAAFNFLRERLRYYLEAQDGIEPSAVRAALGAQWDGFVPKVRSRAKGLVDVAGSDDFAALRAAAIRIRNTLNQSAARTQVS